MTEQCATQQLQIRQEEEGERSKREAEEGEAWTDKFVSLLQGTTEIAFEQIVFYSKLGEGAFGEVWHAQLWDMDVAVKKLKGTLLHDSIVTELAEEVALLRSLRHPNCVLFLGFVKPPHFCIVTEFMALGSLRSILDNSHVRMSARTVIKCAIAVARGMNYLHTQSPAILHRDLNSHNILCHDNWTVKVADYGLSSLMTTEAARAKAQLWEAEPPLSQSTASATAGEGVTKDSPAVVKFVGAIPWRAPEATTTHFLPASDVFSFGVVLWELVTRKMPFDSGRGGAGAANMLAVRAQITSGARPEIPSSCTPVIRRLIESCWQAEPSLRPSFHAIIETLKPYEGLANTTLARWDTSDFTFVKHQPALQYGGAEAHLNWSDTQMDDCVDCISSDLLVFSENQMVANCWSSFLLGGKDQRGLRLLDAQSNLLTDVAAATLTLTDAMGRLMWLVVLPSKEAILKLDELAHRHQFDLEQLYELTCAPLIKETFKFSAFSIRCNAKSALILDLQIDEGFDAELLAVVEQHTIAMLEAHCRDAWRGCAVLTDIFSNKMLLLMLFDGEEARASLEETGFLPRQIANFAPYLTATPIIRRCAVQVSISGWLTPTKRCGFHNLELERCTSRPPSPREARPEAPALSPAALVEDLPFDLLDLPSSASSSSSSSSALGDPSLGSRGATQLSPPAQVGRRRRSISQLIRSIELSPQPTPSLDLEEEASRKSVLSQSAACMPSVSAVSSHASAKGRSAIEFVEVQNIREEVLDSFVCAKFGDYRAGNILVTPNFFCFRKSNRVTRKLHSVMIPIRRIDTLDKTKQSFLPTKGHSLTVTTDAGERFRFKGIYRREDLVRLLLLRATAVMPPKSIMVLINGEPDISSTQRSSVK